MHTFGNVEYMEAGGLCDPYRHRKENVLDNDNGEDNYK